MRSELKTLLLLSLVSTVSAQNRPPSIITGPPKEVFYTVDTVLPCVASGTPSPNKYEWFKDGVLFNLNQNGVSHSGGNLSIENPSEGYYQCSASNTFGTALSNSSRLRQLRLDSASTINTPTLTAKLGSTFLLRCTLQRGQLVVPSANYKWEIVNNVADTNPQILTLDRRLQIDDNGTLTFAYVLPADNQNNKLYRCHLLNTRLNALETSVAYTYVQVDQTSPVQPAQLTNLFNYSWPTIALERESVSLRCFFGGAQDISISWKKPDGSTPGGSRYSFGTSQMQIFGVQKSDEGAYTCTGTAGSLPYATATVNVVVQSAPIFLDINDGPHDINVTIGDEVTINCDAYAIPTATVTWFLNGQQFDSNNLKPKFKLSGDKKRLTISKVCKNCTDGSVRGSDLMVIQCNASNIHGYTFSNGYINVLDPTVIKEPPNDVELKYPDPVIFTCFAVTDVSTPVTYRWLWNDEERYDGYMNTSVPGTLYIDISKADKQGTGYGGKWTCNATNGVSSEAKSANLYTSAISPSMGSVQWWWWIPLIVILLLLLAIALILLICCCIYRNRGEAYPVDKEERKGGNDPEKDLKDSGFHDFQRPVDAPDGVRSANFERAGKGPGSISSSIGKGASDDEMSLDNYANVNHGKFSEDGSFIGQYNPNRRIIQMQPGIPESSA